MITPIAASTIAAQAFRFMEMSPIGSFADTSKQAAAAREQYIPALRVCLEIDDWSFARVMATLPPISPPANVVVDPDMPGLYRLPSGCVALRRVLPDRAMFRVDSDYLRSDQTGGLTIRYTRLIEDETKLPQAFATAVSLQLAIRLAPEHVSSRTKRDRLIADFGDAIDAARLPERTSASHGRLDGRPVQPDWSCEATT